MKSKTLRKILGRNEKRAIWEIVQLLHSLLEQNGAWRIEKELSEKWLDIPYHEEDEVTLTYTLGFNSGAIVAAAKKKDWSKIPIEVL